MKHKCIYTVNSPTVVVRTTSPLPHDFPKIKMKICLIISIIIFINESGSVTRIKHPYMARVIAGKIPNLQNRGWNAVIVSEKLLLTCKLCLGGEKQLFACIVGNCNKITNISESPKENVAILQMEHPFSKMAVHRPIKLISSSNFTAWSPFEYGDCVEVGYELGETLAFHLQFYHIKKSDTVKYRLYSQKAEILKKKDCGQPNDVVCTKGNRYKRCPAVGGSALVCNGYLVGIKWRGKKNDDCKVELYSNVMNVKTA